MGQFAKQARVEMNKRCSVGRVVEEFDNDDMEHLRTLGEKRQWLAIRRAGVPSTSDKIKEHLRGLCMCSPDAKGKGMIADG